MYKSLITGGILFIFGAISILGWLTHHNSYPVFFNKHGQLTSNEDKIWRDTVMPNSATYNIDISSAGFINVPVVTITAQNKTTAIASMPIVVIDSANTTNTTISVNILTQNNSTTTILGITVLSGSPLQLATSTSGMILNVEATGN